MSRLVAVTWNAEGMFVKGTRTRRASPDDAINIIKELDADVIVIPEFGRYQQLDRSYRDELNGLGYTLIETPYEQADLTPEISMVVMSRLPIVSSITHRLAGVRNCSEVHCVDANGTEIRVLAIHLDDRTEQLRMKQIVEVENIVAQDQTIPTLVMGDFNAMPINSMFARFVRTRTMRVVAHLLPHVLLKRMAVRVNEMAIGTTIEHFLRSTHLTNLDSGMQRTVSAKQFGVEWAPSLRLAKIDWIFGTNHFVACDYHIWRDVGSDHRPVRATLTY